MDRCPSQRRISFVFLLQESADIEQMEACFDCHGNLIPWLIISSSSAATASSSRSPLISTTAAASSSPSSSSTTELWSNTHKEMKMRLLSCKHYDLHTMDTCDPVTSLTTDLSWCNLISLWTIKIISTTGYFSRTSHHCTHTLVQFFFSACLL